MTLRTLLSTTCLVTSGVLLAQPTLTGTNSVGAAGTTFAINTAGFTAGYGVAGTAQAYQFNAADGQAPVGNRTFYYVDPGTSSPVPGTTVLVTDGGTDTIFYQLGPTGLERSGERELGGQLVVYSDKPLDLKLPLEYGDTWTDNLAATYTLSGFPVTVTRTGSIVGIADGWGTLQLPVANYNDVLRVKIRKVINDQNPTLPINRSFDTYYFFNGILGHPVLKMSIDTVRIGTNAPTATSSVQWMGGAGEVGISELNFDDVQFTAYPNPASAEVNLDFAADRIARSVEVFNATGNLVKQEALANNSSNSIAGAFNVTGMAQGVYQVRVLFSDGTRSTQRLVVR